MKMSTGNTPTKFTYIRGGQKMKKRITLILTVIFALALAVCGSTAAFAAEESETVDWFFGEFYEGEYYGEYWEYKLLGEAETGKTVIPAETEGFDLCYEFNVPESGYYLLSYCVDDFDWIGFPKEIDEDGSAINSLNGVWVEYDYNCEVIFYLEKGETYIGIGHYYSDEETSFEIEFLGSEIKNLTFADGAFEDYILGVDIWYSYEAEHEYIAREDVTVEFSLGKTVEIKDCELPYDTENDEIVNGVNSITVDFLGYKKQLEMTACNVDKFVSKVEMTNVEDYLSVVQYYDGYVVPEIYEEEATVYFTDGTKETIDFEYGYGTVELPNGREYEVFASYESPRSNEVELVFYVAYEEVTAYECGVETTDFLENFKLLHENKVYIIDDVTASIRRAYADYIWYSDSAAEFVQNFPVLFENCYDYSVWAAYDLICNDLGFFGYVTTGEVYYW